MRWATAQKTQRYDPGCPPACLRRQQTRPTTKAAMRETDAKALNATDASGARNAYSNLIWRSASFSIGAAARMHSPMTTASESARLRLVRCPLRQQPSPLHFINVAIITTLLV